MQENKQEIAKVVSLLKHGNLGANSFFFRVAPFTEGAWIARKETGHKSYLPCKTWQKI